MSDLSFPFSDPALPLVFGGSRSLASSPAAADLVRALVLSVLCHGRRVLVGCAVGVDELVVRCCDPACLSIAAVFAPDGAGAWSGSAVAAVRSAAAAGARVAWLAGGALSLPLRARLARRSSWLAGCCAAGGFVALVAGGPAVSPGSWRSAREAVGFGLPVVVFPVDWPGFDPAALPSLGAGAWSPAAAAGVWSAGWRWVPAAVQPALF